MLAWAGQTHRRFSSAMCAMGLVTSSAVLVHLSGGTIEAHFHFFVMVGIQDIDALLRSGTDLREWTPSLAPTHIS